MTQPFDPFMRQSMPPFAHPFAHPLVRLAMATLAALMTSACADLPTDSAPQVDAGRSTTMMKALPRKPGELTAVSIYEFRSALPEIEPRGATDMFKTALVASGQFRVVERSRLNEGVLREKQLNASGLGSGQSARERLGEAKYLFEGSITGLNAGETQRSGAVGIAGAQIGGSTNRDMLGIDVRMVEVASGSIVAAVHVQKSITGDSVAFSGLGNLINAALAQRDRSSIYVPDVQLQQQRRQGLDTALRSAIDQAVAELASRFRN